MSINEILRIALRSIEEHTNLLERDLAIGLRENADFQDSTAHNCLRDAIHMNKMAVLEINCLLGPAGRTP